MAPLERPVEILVVGERFDEIVSLRRTLLEYGNFPYQLSTVGDGEAALAFLHHHFPYRQASWPDLIILALRLPHLKGTFPRAHAFVVVFMDSSPHTPLLTLRALPTRTPRPMVEHAPEDL